MSLWTSFIVVLSFLGITPPIEQLHDQKILDGYVICVDAGHGGQIGEEDYCNSCYTGGAIGAATGQTEGDVNLRVAYELEDYLKYMGAKTVMTRECRCRISGKGSKQEELLTRMEIAQKNNCNLFLSVHHNHSEKPDINYSLVLYSSKHKEQSKRLASHVVTHVSDTMRVPSNGIGQGDFAVLNHATMPAVIIEASFMSNHKEDAMLCNPMYNRIEAWGIAKGVANYAIQEKTWLKVSPVIKDWTGHPGTKKPKPKPKPTKSTKKKSKSKRK